MAIIGSTTMIMGPRITYIPEAPTREGYTFGGWYKEEECINAWNFETDTLPEAILDEETGGTCISGDKTLC